MTHPTPDLLLKLVEGSLPADGDTQWLVEHLEDCEDCRYEIKLLMQINRLRYRRRRRRQNTAALAAAPVMAIGLLVGIRAFYPWAPPADPMAILATTEPLPQLFVDFYLGSLEPVAVTTMPKSTRDRMGRRELLRTGVQAIADREYGRAVELLREVYTVNPIDEHAVFLGIALYLSGDSSEFVVNLLARGGAVEPDNPVSQEAAWYLGNVLLARGELERAMIVLGTLSERASLPGRRARDLLPALESEAGQ